MKQVSMMHRIKDFLMKKKWIFFVVIAVGIAVSGIFIVRNFLRPHYNKFYVDDLIAENASVSLDGYDYENLSFENAVYIPIPDYANQLNDIQIIGNRLWSGDDVGPSIERAKTLESILKIDGLSTPDGEIENLEGSHYIWTSGQYDIDMGVDYSLVSDRNAAVPEIDAKEITPIRLNEGDSIEGIFLDGGLCSLETAIDYADGIISQLGSLYWADECRLRTVIKCTMEDDSTQFILRYEYLVGGIPIDEAGDYVHQMNGGTMFPNWAEIRISKENKIDSLIIRSFGVQSITPSKEKVLTLEDALQCASEKLAPYGTYKISSIEFKYCNLYIPGKGDTPENEVRKYSPMWVMRVKKSGRSDPANMDPRKNIYVDAQTGAVYILDSTDISLPMQFAK